MEHRFEARIPGQNVHGRTVDRIEIDIAFRKPFGKPLRTRVIIRTVDDVGNVHLGHKPLG